MSAQVFSPKPGSRSAQPSLAPEQDIEEVIMPSAPAAASAWIRIPFFGPYLAFLGVFALTLVLDIRGVYTQFALLNMLWVLFHLRRGFSARLAENLRTWAAIFGVAACLTLLDMVATAHLGVTKDARGVFLAGFVVLGVSLFAECRASLRMRYVLGLALVVAGLFALIQLGSIVLLDKKYGLAKNRHYIALFSAMLIPLAVFGALVLKGWLRLLPCVLAVALAYLLLRTGSRPMWLGLLVGALAALGYAQARRRVVLLSAIVSLPLLLHLTNLHGFADRVNDLLLNLAREERVSIWRDALQMQLQSSPLQWLVGHGLDSFEAGYAEYAMRAGLKAFNSPHNALLDVLYASGALGLTLYLAVCGGLYWHLLRLRKADPLRCRLGAMLTAMLTVNLVSTGLTVPTFSHYSIYPVAFIIGVLMLIAPTPGSRDAAA